MVGRLSALTGAVDSLQEKSSAELTGRLTTIYDNKMTSTTSDRNIYLTL
jgi:hypothetical protein